MTEEKPQVTLEEVRTRFLDAETQLSQAAAAVGEIRDAAARLGSAREGLGAASARLGDLAVSLGEVAASLGDNATHLREGVDAIRAGDPAEIRRQIEELDSAFTAMQSVVADRLTKLDVQTATIGEAVLALRNGLDAHALASRRESRIAVAVLGALVVVSILVAFLT